MWQSVSNGENFESQEPRDVFPSVHPHYALSWGARYLRTTRKYDEAELTGAESTDIDRYTLETETVTTAQPDLRAVTQYTAPVLPRPDL